MKRLNCLVWCKEPKPSTILGHLSTNSRLICHVVNPRCKPPHTTIYSLVRKEMILVVLCLNSLVRIHTKLRTLKNWNPRLLSLLVLNSYLTIHSRLKPVSLMSKSTGRIHRGKHLMLWDICLCIDNQTSKIKNTLPTDNLVLSHPTLSRASNSGWLFWLNSSTEIIAFTNQSLAKHNNLFK
jgi:hypothetical protein